MKRVKVRNPLRILPDIWNCRQCTKIILLLYSLLTCSTGPIQRRGGQWCKSGEAGKVELYAQGGRHQYLEQEQPGKFSPQSISRGVLRHGGRCGNNWNIEHPHYTDLPHIGRPRVDLITLCPLMRLPPSSTSCRVELATGKLGQEHLLHKAGLGCDLSSWMETKDKLRPIWKSPAWCVVIMIL